MFSTIIVTTNLEPNGDRALPVAAALGSLAGVDIDVVKVAPRFLSTEVDAGELARRVAEHGWPPSAARVIESDDIAGAIAAEVDRRPGSLLVMATSARHPVVGHLLNSVSEAVLELVDRPVLLVGPHVPIGLPLTRPTLVVCVHPGTSPERLVAAVVAWAHAFPTTPPRIVEVVPESGFGAGEDTHGTVHVARIVTMLAAEGVEARGRSIHGGIPEIRLEEVADQMLQPLFVVASTRWTGTGYGHSTARGLVHRSTHPVLVVPVRSVPAGASSGPARTLPVIDRRVP